MGDDVRFAAGDKVRHRDAPADAPLGEVLAVAGVTLDGKPVYQVGYRSSTGSISKMRYPGANLVLVEHAGPEPG